MRDFKSILARRSQTIQSEELQMIRAYWLFLFAFTCLFFGGKSLFASCVDEYDEQVPDATCARSRCDISCPDDSGPILIISDAIWQKPSAFGSLQARPLSQLPGMNVKWPTPSTTMAAPRLFLRRLHVTEVSAGTRENRKI